MLFKIPILRQLAKWLGAVDAHFSTLMNLINKGKSLIIFPGGIAELFMSSREHETILLKSRKGFVKLALKTGAELRPVYFFGASQMFDQTIQSQHWLARLSRKMGCSITFFYGRWYLPIPYPAKVTIAIGEAVAEPRKVDNPTQEQIDELHSKCLEAMQRTFDKYKAAAGYPNQVLHIT